MPLYRIGKRRTFDYHYEVEAKDEKEGLDLIDEDVEGTHTSAVSLTHCAAKCCLNQSNPLRAGS